MKLEERKLMNYNKNHKEIDGQLYKRCSIHNEYFPDEDEWFPCNIENFYKNNSSPDGLYPYCKRCNVKKTVQYNRDNKEWHNNYSTEYIKNDYVKERRKTYVKDRRYNEKYREWQQNNPEKLRQYNDKRQHKNHIVSKNEWDNCKEYFNDTCAYCGLSLEEHLNIFIGVMKWTDFHKEHVEHEGENDLSNCIPSCKGCNSSKGTHDFEEWYSKQKFFNQERLDKIHKWLAEDYKLYIEEPKEKRKYNNKQQNINKLY